MKNYCIKDIHEDLEKISPEISPRLENIHEFDPGAARKAVGRILQYACATHSGRIMAARMEFGRLPKDWLDQHLEDVVAQALNLADDWDYRRLLEVLHEHHTSSFEKYRARGLKSSNPDILDAANDALEW